MAASAWAAAAIGSTSAAHAQSGGWTRGNPSDAIVLGWTEDGQPLEVCVSDDPVFPGRHPGWKRPGPTPCTFAYDDRPTTTRSYLSLTPTWTRDADGTPFGREPNGTTQSFCQGWHEGGLHVGKHIDGTFGCAIGYGTREVWLREYTVLNQRGQFSLATTRGSTPIAKTAIVGGKERDGTPLYLCRVSYGGGLHLGKTRADWSDCVIGHGGTEVWARPYEVFVPRTGTGANDLVSAPIFPVETNFGPEYGVCTTIGFSGVYIGKWVATRNTCEVAVSPQQVSKTVNFNTLRWKP